jgi:hypothetical protein|eukprot:SAG25_NODE_502_length_7356_cov_70.227642_6_plen_82_part_00
MAGPLLAELSQMALNDGVLVPNCPFAKELASECNCAGSPQLFLQLAVTMTYDEDGFEVVPHLDKMNGSGWVRCCMHCLAYV